MIWGRLLYISVLLSAAGLAIWLGSFVWRRRATPGAEPFIGMMLAAAVWAATDATQALTPNLAEKLIWNQLGYPAIVSLPVVWFLFIRRQTTAGRAWSFRRIAPLWIIPLITLGMVFTSEQHQFFYTQVSLADTPVGRMAVYAHGPWFWVHAIYSYAMLSAGAFLILLAWPRATGSHRAQLGAMAVGTLIPWIGNAVYILGGSPIPGLDLTPVMFILAGVVYAWSLFRLELLQLTPTARATLVEKMQDGILVLNADDRIVDANPAAIRMLAQAADALFSQPVEKALAGWQDGAGRLPDVHQTEGQVIFAADGTRCLELRASPLTDMTGATVGRLALLRDITVPYRTDQALRESQRAHATLLSNLPGMAYRCRNDRAWTMEFVSQGCYALTGYPAADLLENHKVSYADLIHAEDREKVWESVQSAVQAGRPFQLAYRIVTATGIEKWVWEQGQGIFSPDGELLALEGFIADFTDRVRAEQAEQEQRRFAEALREATIALNSTLDLDQVLDRILAQVGRVIGYDAAMVYLIERDVAQAVRWRGADEQQVAALAHQVWRIEETPNMRAMRAMRQSVVIPDTHATPSWIVLPETAWIASHAGAPICSHDEVLGFLEVDSTRPGFYSQPDGERLRAFADQAALAIQNARLYAETRRRAEQMTMLHRVGLAITAGLSTEQVLRTIYEQCRQLAALDGFYIALYDEATGDIRFPLFLDDDQLVAAPGLNIHTRPGMAGVVIGRGQTLYVPDTLDPEAQRAYPITYVGDVMRTYLGVPLILRERVIGVLSVQHRQPAAFSPDQIRLFETLATQAVIAIDNARLYEQAESERRYLEALIANTPGGIVVIDAEGRVKRWSPAAERIFGYTADEAIGHNIDLLIACGSPQMLREGTRLTSTAFNSERVAHIVTQRMRKDGSLVDVEIYSTPEVTGAARGMILSYHDISELQAARQAAEQANAELRQRLEELDRANTDLQARNEELDAFAHMVAHGLRSPLGNITGYADLLHWDAAQMSAAEVADLALEILEQGRRMRSLIDELLLLATVRKEDVHRAPLNMADIVADALERLAELIGRSAAEVRLPEQWPVALGYAPWVEEVWFNYLSNALQYGGKPPVIELGAEPWGEAMVRFWVRDNGEGIAAEAREHIFLPFTRLSQTPTSSVGLGLSVVQRIIAKLGGEVGVESTAGQGSLFFFLLPAA